MTGHRCITKDPSDGQLLIYWGTQTGFIDESLYSSYPEFASEFFSIDRWEVVAIPGEFL